jgi:hypothetical protein
MPRWNLLILAVCALVPFAGAQEDEPEGSECEICGAFVPMPHQSYLSGNTKYVYIDKRKARRYCNLCRRDINNGKIDPNDPPMLSPRDGSELDGDNPHGNKWAIDEIEVPKNENKLDEESESGFGALGYVIGIVIALGYALRFFLKS